VATTVYLANRITLALDADSASEELLDPDQDEVFKAQGVTAELVVEFQQKVHESLEGIKDFLSSP
jgi:hypothetical protein